MSTKIFIIRLGVVILTFLIGSLFFYLALLNTIKIIDLNKNGIRTNEAYRSTSVNGRSSAGGISFMAKNGQRYKFNVNRYTFGLIGDDGTYYVLYSKNNPSEAIVDSWLSWTWPCSLFFLFFLFIWPTLFTLFRKGTLRERLENVRKQIPLRYVVMP